MNLFEIDESSAIKEEVKAERKLRVILYYKRSDLAFREAAAKLSGYSGFEEYALTAIEEKFEHDLKRFKNLRARTRSHTRRKVKIGNERSGEE